MLGSVDRGSETTGSVISLQESERARIGFDLHDGVAQTISAALLQVRLLADLQGSEFDEALEELRETISLALREVYDLIDDLSGKREPASDLVGHIEALASALAQRSGIAVAVEVEGDLSCAPAQHQVVLFRIIQESLSNVRKHSGARRVDVSLTFEEGQTTCVISDDGRGFDPASTVSSLAGRQAFGLRGMRERARIVGGVCEIASAPGRGTRVAIRIPA